MVLYIFQAEDCNGKRRIRQFPLSTLGSPLKYVILQIQICFAHLSENLKLDPLEGEGCHRGPVAMPLPAKRSLAALADDVAD